MKKLLMYVIIFALIVFIGINMIIQKIQVDITDDILPEDIYADTSNPLLMAQGIMTEFYNPFSTSDEYTLTEEFLNYIILDSIHENVNDMYDPLNDSCTDEMCDIIVKTPLGNVEYAVVELNEDDQMVLTVNFVRHDYPDFETAVILTFDVEIELMQAQITLTLDTIYVHESSISVDMLKRILGLFDAQAIEDSITMGDLDLEEFTYTVTLVP